MSTASLESAKTKLATGNPPFPFDDLPDTRNDAPLWNEIATLYNLSLPEISTLKNARCKQQAERNPADLEAFAHVLSQVWSQSIDDAISNKLKERKTHRVSASGVATGVNSPPPSNQAPSVMMVGSTAMPVESYREAQRYFDLFRAAIRLAYPSGGYEIGLHDSSAQCVVKGRQVFKFPFQPEAIKNHYVTFR
eukprot:gene14885-17438_t